MFLQRFYRGIRRAFGGQVIRQVDTNLRSLGMKLSFQLKLERDEPYVVLVLASHGNYERYPMDLDEFDSVLEAMKEIRESAAKL